MHIELHSIAGRSESCKILIQQSDCNSVMRKEVVSGLQQRGRKGNFDLFGQKFFKYKEKKNTTQLTNFIRVSNI